MSHAIIHSAELYYVIYLSTRLKILYCQRSGGHLVNKLIISNNPALFVNLRRRKCTNYHFKLDIVFKRKSVMSTKTVQIKIDLKITCTIFFLNSPSKMVK